MEVFVNLVKLWCAIAVVINAVIAWNRDAQVALTMQMVIGKCGNVASVIIVILNLMMRIAVRNLIRIHLHIMSEEILQQ